MSFLDRQARLVNLVQEEQLREWLTQFEDEQEVGYGCAPDNCPIARYIRAQGYHEAYIHVDPFNITVGLTRIKTPVWAVGFISKADIYTVISKVMALRFLSDDA